MIQLTQEALKRLKSDEELQLRIAQGMGNKKIRTVRHWVREYEKNGSEENLTSQAVVLIISKVTGLPEGKVVTKVPAEAVL